jgi:subtilisin family serine protease
VAGTVLGRSPSALLICRQVLVPGESNRSWDVANRLMGFLDDDIDVLNMSFGCKAEAGEPLPMRRAVDRLGERTVLVAAVGNHALDEGNRPLYPAAFGNVIAVGADEFMRGSEVTPADAELAESTPDVPWLDLLAPGLNRVGPYLVGKVPADRATGRSEPTVFASGYVQWSGSSFAAAAATGEIAQLMVERGIDAFAARDVLLQDGVRNVQPFAYDLTAQGLLS